MREKNRENICIILAKANSKGLKNKNIISFNGKPMLYHTINPILKSQIFDKIIVSTDSRKIQSLAYKFGAEAPFLRPKKLATNSVSFHKALVHSMDWINKEYGKYKNVLYAFPTNPLRENRDFRKAYNLLKKLESDLIISVSENSHPSYWSNELKLDHSMRNFIPKKYCVNRQELPKTYRVDGSIFFGKWNILYNYNKRNFFNVNSHAMIMPRSRSVDIDTYQDFLLAKVKLNEKK
tara:strand:+ start:8127 stop:8834 length:708 start_codon:yes stop_codon:yes gene_type:complete